MPRRRTLARTLAALSSGLWLAGCFVSINDYKAAGGSAHAGSGSGGVRDGGAGRGAGGVSEASTEGGSGGAAGSDGGATGGRGGASDASTDGGGSGGSEAGASGGTNAGGTNTGGSGAGGGAGGSKEAGTDASTGGAGGGPVGCGLTELPKQPPRAIITGLGEFSVSLRSLNLGDGPPGCTGGPDLTVGMNLDEQCNGNQRVFRAGACGGGTAEDGPGGIDNQLAALLNGLQCAGAGFEDYTSTKINSEIQNGDYTILLTISRYNFSPSDDDVTVKLRLGGILANPTFTAADTWPIATLPGDPAPYEVTTAPRTAYVSGGVLVAKLGDFPLKMPLGDTTLTVFDLHDAALSCRIETPDGGDPKLSQCVLAGAWRVSDVFAQLGAIEVSPGQPLCASDPNFEFGQDIIDSLCGAADLAVQQGRGCDAVSFGVTFETAPVHLGPVQAVDRTSFACPSVPDCPIRDQ